jgi:gamma-glutamylcyclotransferase (GGCT)/AIG2-like uncharacterized protein YtfP
MMSTVGCDLRYFAYGTLQKGFPNWLDLADRLGDPIGRFRTAGPYALVVPLEPGCWNPGCGLLHRMAALVPGVAALRVEGDLFAIDRSALAEIDRLENYDDQRPTSGLYVRGHVHVRPLSGGSVLEAIAYRVRDPAPWLALVSSGRAELLASYERGFASATLKACCRAEPGHAGPHDVIDPFAR